MTASIGDKMRLKQLLPYLKTADPMPMLRPSDLISPQEVGEVVALHPLDTVAAVSYTHLTLPTILLV